MSFHIERAGDTTIVRVVENLTFVNQKEFLAIGDDLVRNQAPSAVLDLSGITYFGSMAFGLVAKTFNSLKEAGCRLVVVRPQKDEVFQVFKITRMTELMEFFATEDDALKELGVDTAARETVSVGEEDPVEARIANLSDSDPEVRRYTAWALGQLGDSRALTALKGCLKDADQAVREAAAESLEKISSGTVAPK